MYCIVKDGKTFRAKTDTTCSVTDYDLTLESIYDEVSDIAVVGARGKPKEGDFVFIENGYMGIVSEVETDKVVVNMKIRQMVTLFDRDIFYAEPQGVTVEARLKHMIDVNFTSQPDVMYRLPYLEVIAETSTSANVKPDIENGIYNIKSFIAKLRRLYSIFVTFEAKRDKLIIRIARKIVPIKQIDFSDADLRVIERSFSCESIGRITTKAEDTGEVKNWYRLVDGMITNTYTGDGRTDGKWRLLNVREAKEAPDAARNEFLSNSYSHIIAFAATPQKARFGFYDSVKISLESRLFVSYIAAVKIKKDSRLVEYQCGELRTTYPLKEMI